MAGVIPLGRSHFILKIWITRHGCHITQLFDYVEIDSTFYNIPSELMVKKWNRRTPDNFRFTVKFPKIITHEKRFKNVQKDLELFYERIEPLKDKIIALLIQSLPSYKLKEGLDDFSSHGFFL